MKQLFMVGFFSLFGNITLACTCAEQPSVTTAWEGAEQVLIGSVITEPVCVFGSVGGTMRLFTIKVHRVLKGHYYEGLDQRSFFWRGSGSCDTYFSMNEPYLIYAHEDQFFLTASSCSRTAPIRYISTSEWEQLQQLQQKEQIRLSTTPRPRFLIGVHDHIPAPKYYTLVSQLEWQKTITLFVTLIGCCWILYLGWLSLAFSFLNKSL